MPTVIGANKDEFDKSELEKRGLLKRESDVPETGKPIDLHYLRNTESSKKHGLPAGMDFGQHLEPSGEYMNVDKTPMAAPDERWEAGKISFSNPLVLPHKSTDSHGWKKDLSEMFGGKTGKQLTAAIKKHGHDAIITHDKYGLNETVNLSGKKVINKEKK